MMVPGWHQAPVNSWAAAAVMMTVFFLSAACFCTAAATGVTGRSVMASTPWSYHWRAMAPATSGLFWLSAARISIGRPSTLGPKSAAAMRAARVAPGPDASAE